MQLNSIENVLIRLVESLNKGGQVHHSDVVEVAVMQINKINKALEKIKENNQK